MGILGDTLIAWSPMLSQGSKMSQFHDRPLCLPPVPCRKKDDRLSYRKHYKLIVGSATYKKQCLLYGNEGDLLEALRRVMSPKEIRNEKGSCRRQQYP
jgi:hypothetical protein